MTITTVKQTRIFYGLLAAFSLTLSGCGVFFGDDGYFRNRADDYLKADSIEPLKVPPHLNSEAPGELYVIPPLTEDDFRSEEHTSELQSRGHLVCRLLLRCPSCSPLFPYTTLFRSLLAAFSLTLSGCGVFFGDDGYFRNRADDYLKADSIEPLKVPPHLNSEAPGELYVIPPLTEDDFAFVEDTDRFDVPRPRGLSANALVERVKIQRLGAEQWILVNVQPGQVWPQISNFLSSNELQVARTDINQGLLETGWISFGDEPDQLHRFRVRIDRGVQPDSSEIHILHMSVPRGEDVQASAWPERSTSQEREHWLVEELAQNLASEDIAALGGTSLVAQAIGGCGKSDLSMRTGEPVLTLQLSRERALANLAHATQQQGLVTFDSAICLGGRFLCYQKPDTR